MNKRAIQILFIVAISGYSHILNGQVADEIEGYLSSYEAALNNLSDPSYPHSDRLAFRLDIEDKYYTENTMIYNHLFKGGTRNLTGYEYVENLLVDYNEPIRHRIEAEESLSTDMNKPVIVVKYTLTKGSESKVDRFQFTLDVTMFGRGVFKGKILSIMPYEELVNRGEERRAAERKAERERRAETTAWAAAERRDTKAGYEGYLADYPDGAHARQARSKIDDIEARERAEAERRRAASKSPAEKAAEEIASTMVEIAGGTFTMGCTSEQGDDCDDDERPAHEVYVSGFELNKYEVTQAQWRAIMGSDPDDLYNTGCDRCPVDMVSWNDVQEFIRELNRISNGNYRLPTEAEWEYAARGGQKAKPTKYAGRNNINKVANVRKEGLFRFFRKTKIRDVGQYEPNELGLYDMSGNVWEWCSDWHDYDYYEASPRSNPMGPSSGTYRVLRGGGCSPNYSAWHCRVSSRDVSSPGTRGLNGCRLAR